MIPKDYISTLPVYEPGKPIEEVARELGFKDIDEIIKVASNENELGPSPKAIEAIKAHASQMHRYPDGGAFALKKKMAAKLGVQPENLMFGNGSNEIIELLGNIYLSNETNWVCSQGAFAVYFLVAKLFNSKAIMTPMINFAHDLDAMLDAITPETRVIIVCNPNNPTGTIVSPKAIYEFIGKLPPHVLAVFDEAYFEYLSDEDKPDLISLIKKGAQNIMVLRTFSKIYGLAGLRIGYAIAHPNQIALLNKARQPFNVNLMALEAAHAALDDNDFVKKARLLNSEGLRQFEEALPNIAGGLEWVPSYANFILVKTGRGREIFELLQKKKILVRPMDGYGLADWIRITIGTPEQNIKVLETLKATLEK